MSQCDDTDLWVPLMDYAMQTGVSISTLRRYIKKDKIPYRFESGRYFVKMNPDDVQKPSLGPSEALESAESLQSLRQAQAQEKEELARLKKDLKKAREEIAELKMLIALYEERSVNS